MIKIYQNYTWILFIPLLQYWSIELIHTVVWLDSSVQSRDAIHHVEHPKLVALSGTHNEPSPWQKNTGHIWTYHEMPWNALNVLEIPWICSKYWHNNTYQYLSITIQYISKMKNNEKHKFKQSSDTHSQIQPRIAQRREIVLSRSWCNHGYLFPVWPLTIISYYFMLFHIISISALLFKCSWFFNMFSYVCYRIKIYQNNKAIIVLMCSCPTRMLHEFSGYLCICVHDSLKHHGSWFD